MLHLAPCFLLLFTKEKSLLTSGWSVANAQMASDVPTASCRYRRVLVGDMLKKPTRIHYYLGDWTSTRLVSQHNQIHESPLKRVW